MKLTRRLPKILRINEVKGLKVSVLFSDGQDRILDFNKILHRLKPTQKEIVRKLNNPKEFKKVKLNDFTLCWENVTTTIELSNGKLKVPFEIGADVLFTLSEPDLSRETLRIGDMLKELRIKKGLTQDEVAELSGTSRTYISKIENNKSDIELFTLEKIIKAGFNKRLKLQIV